MSARGSAARARRTTSAPEREDRRTRGKRPTLRTVPEAPPRRRRPALGRMGLLAVPLIAALLGGIVWINVAKLNVTAQTGAVLEQSRSVESDNVRLQGQLEQRNSQVIDDAQARLGMVPAPNDQVVRLTAPAAPVP